MLVCDAGSHDLVLSTFRLDNAVELIHLFALCFPENSVCVCLQSGSDVSIVEVRGSGLLLDWKGWGKAVMYNCCVRATSPLPPVIQRPKHGGVQTLEWNGLYWNGLKHQFLYTTATVQRRISLDIDSAYMRML